MPRLPDTIGTRVARSTGSVPQVQAPRPVRVGGNVYASVAEGLAAVSDSLSRIGRYEQAEQDKAELTHATNALLSDKLELDRLPEQDQDYSTWGQRYRSKFEERRNLIAESITDPDNRAQWVEDSKGVLLRGLEGIHTNARRREVDDGRARLDNVIQGNLDKALATTDKAAREILIAGIGEEIDLALSKNYITAQEASQKRREAPVRYASRRLAILPPDERMQVLSPAPALPGNLGATVSAAAQRYGVDQDTLFKIAMLESSGRADAVNPQSGASGLFQFMPATAEQYGLSDPNDPAQAADAAARLLADNAQALRSTLHRDPTPAELYLAHQQGAGGAAALIGNPDRLAVEVLADLYGSKSAAEKAITQNGGTTSMTAGEFAEVWAGKFNEMTLEGAKPPQWIQALPVDVRAAELEDARRESRAGFSEGFKGYLKAIASGVETLPSLDAKYSDAAILANDPENAADLIRQRNTVTTIAADAKALPSMKPEEFRETYTQAAQDAQALAGNPDQMQDRMAALERIAALEKGWNAVTKEREADPVGSLVKAGQEGVAEALQAFSENPSPQTYEALRRVREAGFEALGHPEFQRATLPKSFIDGTVKRLSSLDPESAAAELAILSQAMGDEWWTALNDMKDAGLSREVMWAALVPDNGGAQSTLISVARAGFSEVSRIVKDGRPEDAKTADEELAQEFQDAYAVAGLDNTGFVSELHGAAKALTYQRLASGMDVEDAVSGAVKAVLGDQFTVLNTRELQGMVPAQAGLDSEILELGARAWMATNLGKTQSLPVVVGNSELTTLLPPLFNVDYDLEQFAGRFVPGMRESDMKDLARNLVNSGQARLIMKPDGSGAVITLPGAGYFVGVLDSDGNEIVIPTSTLAAYGKIETARQKAERSQGTPYPGRGDNHLQRYHDAKGLPTGAMPDYRPLQKGEYLREADGTRVTDRSIPVQVNGKWMNVPSIWMGPDGAEQLDDADTARAASLYMLKSGEMFPTFDTLEDATKALGGESRPGGTKSGGF